MFSIEKWLKSYNGEAMIQFLMIPNHLARQQFLTKNGTLKQVSITSSARFTRQHRGALLALTRVLSCSRPAKLDRYSYVQNNPFEVHRSDWQGSVFQGGLRGFISFLSWRNRLVTVEAGRQNWSSNYSTSVKRNIKGLPRGFANKASEIVGDSKAGSKSTLARTNPVCG